MYERFYNLRERPFALSPDPEYLYLSRVHREALNALRYGIESRAGFIVVTGEIGAGKTTLLQKLIQQLDDRTVVARIVNTTLEPRELLEAILLDFGLTTVEKSKPALLRDLGQFLVQQRAQGRRPLLVIDEAQNLSPEALEEVRLLSNLETEKSKLLQILLVGQPNLRAKINAPELEQFRQRVAVSYHLTALDAPDTAAYINYRLEHAAVGEPPRFPTDASALVHGRSGGVPRIINVICDATLVFGYAEERRTINRFLLEEVISELETTGVLATPVGSGTMVSVAEQSAAAINAETVAPMRTVSSPDPHPPGGRGAGTPARDALTHGREAAAAHDVELARQRELVSRRLAELAAREEALARRESQIAEQRQVMSEEYRLLRQRQTDRMATAAAPGAHPGTGTITNAPRSAPPVRGTRPIGARRVPALTIRASRHTPFWQRIFRFFGREAALRP